MKTQHQAGADHNAGRQGEQAPARIVRLTAPAPAASLHLLEGFVRVCARCHPGDSIYQRHPRWRSLGLRISHGLCAQHAAEQHEQVRRFLNERKEAA